MKIVKIGLERTYFEATGLLQTVSAIGKCILSAGLSVADVCNDLGWTQVIFRVFSGISGYRQSSRQVIWGLPEMCRMQFFSRSF